MNKDEHLDLVVEVAIINLYKEKILEFQRKNLQKSIMVLTRERGTIWESIGEVREVRNEKKN